MYRQGRIGNDVHCLLRRTIPIFCRREHMVSYRYICKGNRGRSKTGIVKLEVCPGGSVSTTREPVKARSVPFTSVVLPGSTLTDSDSFA